MKQKTNILARFKQWILSIVSCCYSFYNKYLRSDKVVLGNGRIYSRRMIRNQMSEKIFNNEDCVLEHPTSNNIGTSHRMA